METRLGHQKNPQNALEVAILGELGHHLGRGQAVGRSKLVSDVQWRGCLENEREVREAIKQLRRRGHLICAMPGTDGGYYLASSKAEFEEFDRLEFGAKILDMNETRQAMLKAARVQFGEAVQLSLEGA